jgi:PEGA domain
MPARTACALFAVAAALLTGCVERRFRIESNPPGAYVLVNSLPYGPTPVDIPFIYYGHYDIVLMKDGYVTKRVRQDVPAPWYQYPPIDFFAESLWPRQITDIRPLIYDLEPLPPPNLVQLKAEAVELRERAKTLPPPRYPDFGKEDTPPKAPAPPKAGDLPAPRPIPELEVIPPRPVRPPFDPLPGRSSID